MRRLERRIATAAITAVLLCGTAAFGTAASAGATSGRGSPELIQLSYFESPGAQGADRGLEAFARHTRSMHFAISFRGRSAHAPGKYRDSITDTDIHGKRAKHPWTPDRKQGGRRVIRLVHKSLHRRGVAKVRLRARKGSEVDRERVRIELSQCAKDPPLYPVDCEVRIS